MSEKRKLNYIALIKGILSSILFSCILILIITCICYWGNISEKILGVLLFSASVISVFLSSILVTKKTQHAGLIYGSLNGLIYFIIVLTAAICFSGKFTPSSQNITMFIGTVLSGALGGILGVNK